MFFLMKYSYNTICDHMRSANKMIVMFRDVSITKKTTTTNEATNKDMCTRFRNSSVHRTHRTYYLPCILGMLVGTLGILRGLLDLANSPGYPPMHNQCPERWDRSDSDPCTEHTTRFRISFERHFVSYAKIQPFRGHNAQWRIPCFSWDD